MYCIPRLDLMITYGCNLACAGCISLSDYKRSGPESMHNLKLSFDKWSLILRPKMLTLFGGEPCIHPDLLEICAHVRRQWPSSTIRLITNGYLLDRFCPDRWFDFSPFEIQVSIHRKDHEKIINRQIKNILLQKKSWVTKQHTGSRTHKQIEWTMPGFAIYKSIFNEFVIPYKTNNGKIEPWNSDPTESHKICGAPSTPILFKDRLYKCPAVANTIDLTGNSWYGYHGYDADDDIKHFVSNINKPEPVCGQCPDREHAVVVDHFKKENVIVKTKNFD